MVEEWVMVEEEVIKLNNLKKTYPNYKKNHCRDAMHRASTMIFFYAILSTLTL